MKRDFVEGALTMRKCMIVPVLLLSLLLTACGGEEAGSGRNSFWTELNMDAMETVLVIDGREVPAWRYCWWLAVNCRAMEEACAAAGLVADWNAPVEHGTLSDYVQAQALADTALYATVENRAEVWGAELRTEPAGTGIAAGGEMPLEDWQRQELEAVGLLYGELCAMAEAENSQIVTKEMLAEFAARENYLTVDRIVIPFGENRETARQQAEEAFGRLNQAVDKEAVFSALSAGDGSAEPVTVQAEDGTLEPGLASAATALEVGQYSGILEASDGFYILRRLEPESGALAPIWLEQELLQAAADADIEKRESFARLTVSAVQQALAAEFERES